MRRYVALVVIKFTPQALAVDQVLVFLPGDEGPVVSLAPIYEWAARRGFPSKSEHVLIEGVPVQFLPAHDELADETIERAAVEAVDQDALGGTERAEPGEAGFRHLRLR